MALNNIILSQSIIIKSASYIIYFLNLLTHVNTTLNNDYKCFIEKTLFRSLFIDRLNGSGHPSDLKIVYYSRCRWELSPGS